MIPKVMQLIDGKILILIFIKLDQMEQSVIRQGPVREVFEFIDQRRAPGLYFKKFLSQKSDSIPFPINIGYPVISTNCKTQQCYKFIDQETINGSFILSIMKGKKIKCEYCQNMMSSQNLVYDGNLQALFDRNFRREQKRVLDTVLISRDYQIVAERDERWNKMMKKVDRARIQRLSELQKQFEGYYTSEMQERKKNPQNAQYGKNVKYGLKVNIPNIFKEMEEYFKNLANKQVSSPLMKQKSSKQISSSIDFCIIFRHQDSYKIYRYYQSNNQVSINTAYSILRPELRPTQIQLQGMHLAYDKKTQRIFIVTNQFELYYSNFVNMVQPLVFGLQFRKLGRLIKPSHCLQRNASYFSTYFCDDNFYIVGGRASGQFLKYVFRINISRLINRTSDNNQTVELQLFTQLNEGRAMAGLVKCGKDMIVIGGAGQSKNAMADGVGKVQKIDVYQNKNPSIKSVMQGSTYKIGSPSLGVFENDSKVVIWGGNRDCSNASEQQENKNLIIIDIEKKVSVFQTPISQYKQLDFAYPGFGDSNQTTLVMMRLQADLRVPTFSIIKVTKINNEEFVVNHDFKQVQRLISNS